MYIYRHTSSHNSVCIKIQKERERTGKLTGNKRTKSTERDRQAPKDKQT